MYAVAVAVNIDAGREDEAREILRTRIVPMVKQSPGLVAAYFMEPGAGLGYSLLVYDSLENANNAREMAERAPRPDFVKVGTVQVMEVTETL